MHISATQSPIYVILQNSTTIVWVDWVDTLKLKHSIIYVGRSYISGWLLQIQIWCLHIYASRVLIVKSKHKTRVIFQCDIDIYFFLHKKYKFDYCLQGAAPSSHLWLKNKPAETLIGNLISPIRCIVSIIIWDKLDMI